MDLDQDDILAEIMDTPVMNAADPEPVLDAAPDDEDDAAPVQQEAGGPDSSSSPQQQHAEVEEDAAAVAPDSEVAPQEQDMSTGAGSASPAPDSTADTQAAGALFARSRNVSTTSDASGASGGGGGGGGGGGTRSGGGGTILGHHAVEAGKAELPVADDDVSQMGMGGAGADAEELLAQAAGGGGHDLQMSAGGGGNYGRSRPLHKAFASRSASSGKGKAGRAGAAASAAAGGGAAAAHKEEEKGGHRNRGRRRSHSVFPLPNEIDDKMEVILGAIDAVRTQLGEETSARQAKYMQADSSFETSATALRTAIDKSQHEVSVINKKKEDAEQELDHKREAITDGTRRREALTQDLDRTRGLLSVVDERLQQRRAAMKEEEYPFAELRTVSEQEELSKALNAQLLADADADADAESDNQPGDPNNKDPDLDDKDSVTSGPRSFRDSALSRSSALSTGSSGMPGSLRKRKKGRKGVFVNAIVLPGSVIEHIYTFVDVPTCVASELCCRAWHRFMVRTCCWRAALSHSLALGPRDYVEELEKLRANKPRCHEHYTLVIEVSKKDGYILRVDAVETPDSQCGSLTGAREETTLTEDKKKRQIIINVCEQAPGDFSQELMFCVSVVAQNSELTQIKINNARMAAELDEHEGTKRILSRDIQWATKEHEKLSASVRDLTQQLSSDEVTKQFLATQVSDVERAVEEKRAELEEDQQRTERLKAEKQELLRSLSSQNEEQQADAMIKQLEQHKQVLAREVTNLRADLQAILKEQQELKQEYRTAMKLKRSGGSSGGGIPSSVSVSSDSSLPSGSGSGSGSGPAGTRQQPPPPPGQPPRRPYNDL